MHLNQTQTSDGRNTGQHMSVNISNMGLLVRNTLCYIKNNFSPHHQNVFL